MPAARCDAVSAARLSLLLPDLRWRGLVHDLTEGLEARLATNAPIRAYNGFDPTFRSLKGNPRFERMVKGQ